jgi:hypothetical protein
MKNNKTAAIAIAILLTISMTSSMILIPQASAHNSATDQSHWNIPTFALINAAPNPVGVGQQAYIIMWLTDTYDPSSALSNNYRFHNYKLTITAPDGNVTTQTFATITDPTSNQPYAFTPDQVGTYTLNFTFPGQDVTVNNDNPNSVYINDTYLPSSAQTTLTVQQGSVPTLPTNPLPTSYWTRPIYGTNSNWYTISSDWLGSGAVGYSGYSLLGSAQMSFPGDAVGPLTGHVMWTQPIQYGGVVGGNNFAIQGDTFFEGSAYNQRFQNPIIIAGMLYYTQPISFAGASTGPTVCVNLQTGQTVWSRTDVPALSFGYIYDVQDPNQHGVYPPLLFTSAWRAFDAYTGNPLFNITNVPSGTTVLGVNGEHLIWTLTNKGTSASPNYYLTQWNSSNLWTGQYSGASTSPSVIPPITNGADPRMYDWNISVPDLNTITGGSASIVDAFFNGTLVGKVGNLPSAATIMFRTVSSTPYTYFGIDLTLNKIAADVTNSNTSALLWTNTITPAAGNVTVLTGPADPKAGVFTEAYAETTQWVGYSMATGKQIWGPTTGQTAFDYYGNPATPNVQGVVANGILYSSGFGGICYAYDISHGTLLWTYGNGGEGNSTYAGLETPFGEYPTFIQAIGNGVVYLVTTEHTIETPIFKGALARAINATTGAEIWTLSDYTGEFFAMSYAIADGYATFFNGYDNQVYSVGQGPSAITVSAPNTGVASGSSVVIRGTVTDISAGTKQTTVAANFPTGVPVSSDASMREWMGYVYQQQPKPTNFTGVSVAINVVDSNGNQRTIGTAITDETGMYSVAWTPDISGNFTVTASFAGTNGYYQSSAKTTFTVDAAHPTVAPTETPPQSTADQYFVPAIAGLFVLIIIVLALIVMMMVRKK